MKKYSIYSRLDGVVFTSTIEGYLSSADGYYHITDIDNKSHYYPIRCTVIREL